MKVSHLAKRQPLRKPAASTEAVTDEAHLMLGQQPSPLRDRIAQTMLLNPGSVRITQAFVKGKGGKQRLVFVARNAQTGAPLVPAPSKFLPRQVLKRQEQAAAQAKIKELLGH